MNRIENQYRDDLDAMIRLLRRVRDDPADENEAAETIQYANDIMLSRAAFCGAMRYAAANIPPVAGEALELRRLCINNYLHERRLRGRRF